MVVYILKRLTLGVVTLGVILFCSYAMLRLAPGDPAASTMLGESNAGSVDTKGGLATNSSIRKELHLDEPLWYGFTAWLGKVVKHGDFGRSVTVDPGKPVVKLIGEKISTTLKLNIWAVIITYLVAIPLGVHASRQPGGKFDKGSSFILFVLYSLPVMWVGLLLQVLFCEGGNFEIFPLQGLDVPDKYNMNIWKLQFEIVRHYALPVLCLSYAGFAALSRYSRDGMLNQLNSDYVRSARAKGLPESAVIWKHAFRNSVITLITLFSGLLPALISGSVIVEYIFNIQGMGNLSLLSLSSRDYPLQMAIFFFSGALTLAGILIADLLYMLADPRIDLTE